MNGAPYSRPCRCLCLCIRCSLQDCIEGSLRIRTGIPTFSHSWTPRFFTTGTVWVIRAFLQLCSTQDRAVGSLRLLDGWQSRQWPCVNPSPRILHCHELLKDSFSSFLQPLQSLGKPGALSSVPLIQAMLWWSRQWDSAGGRTLHNFTVTNITVSHVWQFGLYEMELHEGLFLCKETFWAYQGRGKGSFQPPKK